MTQVCEFNFSQKDIPIGGPYDPPTSWNHQLTRGGFEKFITDHNSPEWLSSITRGGFPALTEKLEGRHETHMSPIRGPPAFDLDSWKLNDHTLNSHINSTSPEDYVYLSGYAYPETCENGFGNISGNNCGNNYREDYRENLLNDMGVPVRHGQINAPIPTVERIQENFYSENFQGNPLVDMGVPVRHGQINAPIPTVERIQGNFYSGNLQGNVQGNLQGNVQGNLQGNLQGNVQRNVQENYSTQDTALPYRDEYARMVYPMYNTACNMNPTNPEYGLPLNYCSSNNERNSELKTYNENLMTSNIGPNTFTRTTINEIANSNIGISSPQPLPYLHSTETSKNRMYERNAVPETEIPVIPNEVSVNDIYDPRFSGYGTSYRSYLEPSLGQVRYMYDDINAIKFPSMIVRSNIDTENFADLYGPIQENREFGISESEIRQDVNNSWLERTGNFRSEMSEMLMRKNNAVAWQRRQAPFGQPSLVRRGGN